MPFGWTSPDEISGTYESIVDSVYTMAEAYYYFGKLNDAIKLLKASQQFIDGFADEKFQQEREIQAPPLPIFASSGTAPEYTR